MLDFTNNTEWYIAKNINARKHELMDKLFIKEFLMGFYQCYYSGTTANLLLVHNVIGTFLEFTRDNILSIEVYNINTNRPISLIHIKIDDYLTVAEISLIIIEQSLNESVIIDIISWLIDYSFYELYCEEIVVIIPEVCIQANKFMQEITARQTTELSKKAKLISDTLLRCEYYRLTEVCWPGIDMQKDAARPDYQRANAYIKDTILPFFNPSIKTRLYSTIIDYNYKVVAATDASAISIGLENSEQVLGASYKYYSRIDTAIWYFGKWYNSKTAHLIHRYARMIFRIQQYVFKFAIPASFIDYLPYDKGINSYLVTFSPIFDNECTVIALQTIAVDYRYHGYSGYLGQEIVPQFVNEVPGVKLSTREEEVLYLLISGMTQEQIAILLNIKRPTVASIIRNQLCPKFNLPVGNSKLIVDYARAIGLPKVIPQSLWLPSVIIHDANLASWINGIRY